MALGDWWADSPSLRGIFGTILNATAQHQSTSDIWQAFHNEAETQAERILRVSLGRDPTPDEVANAARTLFPNPTIQQMNDARSVAGDWRAAKEALAAKAPGQQVDRNDIWRPPWATTGMSSASEPRYRIKVNWEVQFRGFTTVNRSEWATYDLTGPLTSIEDAIQQALNGFSSAKYNNRTSVVNVIDYEIQVV